MIDPSFSDYYNYELLSGRFLDDGDFTDDPSVCVIEDGYMGRSVGDKVEIGSWSYTIVGVIKSALFMGRILIPQCRAYDAYTARFEIVIPGKPSELHNINWDMPDLILNENTTTVQYTAPLLQYLVSIDMIILLICVLFFAYMLFNTYNILKNKTVEDARGIGIRMALGAGYSEVSRQFFIEILLLMVFANLILFALDPLLAPIITTTFEHRLGIITVATMLAACVLSAYVMTKIVLKKIKKLPVIAVMRENI